MQQQPYQYTKGQAAVERARASTDNIVLGVTFGVFFLLTFGYSIASYFFRLNERTNGVSAYFTRKPNVALELLVLVVSVLVSLVIILGIGMFMTRVLRQKMLGNSLEVQYSDYAWLRDWSNEVAADLDMPQVEIFITQNPIINAYAFGFARPYAIVLHSGSIRYLTEDELKVVVVHEMAHIKYKHTDASVFLLPFLMAPVVSVVTGWIAGFWQRRAEFTADRLALAHLGDAELVKNSLIKVHVGPDVSDDMNDVARQWLQYKAERPMNRFAQTFSSHPYLVRRLSQVDYWNSAFNSTQAPQVQVPQPIQPVQPAAVVQPVDAVNAVEAESSDNETADTPEDGAQK